MERVKSFKRSAAVAAMVASLLAALFVPALKNGVFAAEHSQYYNDNKELVSLIDKDDIYFSQLDLSGNSAQMQAIVEVATAVAAFEQSYDEADYLEDDFKEIEKIFERCEFWCKVKGETTDGDNYYLNYSAFVESNLEKIAEYKDMADEYLTAQERFDEYVAFDQKYFDKKAYNMLSDTRVNPTAAPNAILNVYDAAAIEEVNEIVSQAKLALDALSLNRSDDQSIDDAYRISVNAVDEMKNEYSAQLDNVDRNDLERAVSAIEDYYAAVEGGSEENIAAAKQIADDLVKKGYAFLEGAEESVARYYAADKAELDDYTAKPKEHDFSDIENKSSVSDDKGVVTITATVDGAEINIFPYNAKAVVADNSGSIYKLNAENEIIGIDGNVSVAYCIDVSVYRGVGKWNCPTEIDGKEVIYKVAVDLSKYFTEYVENYSTWFDDKLKENDIEKENRENYIDAIKECVKYISENDTDAKLCYHYLGRSNIEGLVASVEGDTVIFETKSFSNFAVVKAGGRSVLTSPVFWLIFILALVVAFVTFVIVMACIKYTITFNTNGGSLIEPIKVRKDEYFIMPKAPTKRGYTFGGWFEDQSLNVRFVDTCMVKRRSFKVYAKWNEALTPEQNDIYFGKLREMLASHAAIGDSYEIEKGATIRLAKLVNDDIEVKLYLALNPENVLKETPVNVRAVSGENYSETPLLKTVDSVDAFDEAVKLIELLIAQYDLKETEPAEFDEAAEEYVLELKGEDATDVEKESATKEQLLDYFKEIRKFAKGFALAADNGEIDKDAVILRVLLKDDCVEVYLKGDADKLGVEKAEGALSEGTPAFVKICCDETFDKAKAAVKAVMDELGLEETGKDVDLGESDAKSFGYKLKFEE